MKRGTTLWAVTLGAACALLLCVGSASFASVASASAQKTASAGPKGLIVRGLDHQQVVAHLAGRSLEGRQALDAGTTVDPHQSASCTFNSSPDTVSLSVSPGTNVAISCLGFDPDETVQIFQASPLLLNATTDTAYPTAGLNEIDTSSVMSVTASGSGAVDANFVIPTVFTAPDKSAVCPPSAIQENSGFLRCFIAAVGETSLSADLVALTYPGQQVTPGAPGYDEVASDGGMFTFNSHFYGSMGGHPLDKPIVGMAIDTITGGYYEVASDGGIFAFHAPFYGSMGGKPLNKPIVGMAFDPDTGGYYEVASDGGIFAFHAPFLGSKGGQPLNKPIVGIAYDPDSLGYYEVGSDGGIFSFHAPYEGSMGGKALNKPVVGMAFFSGLDENGNLHEGYWEVASDGGIFSFPSGALGIPFQGSMGGLALDKPMVGIGAYVLEGGYWEVASDGGIFSFPNGGTPYLGSMGGKPLNAPIVGIGTDQVS